MKRGWNTDGEVYNSDSIFKPEVDGFLDSHLQQTGFDVDSDDAGCLENTAESFQDAASFGPGVESQHVQCIPTGVHADSSGRSGQVVVADISACEEAVYSMLMFSPPKTIWNQGAWADILAMDSF